MDDLEFLKLKPEGQASFTTILPDGVISTIDGINLDAIQERCPILALAFEPGPNGSKFSIEETSLPLAASFLRFLYIGDYTCLDPQGDPKPCSLLLHAQLCRMGENFQVPDLSQLANANMILETQKSCSYSTPPLELCEAIEFLYTKLPNQTRMIDTILHYCVSCFNQHQLSSNEQFCKLVYELPPFHKDLFRVNHQRGFEDEGAMNILRLPQCKTQPTPEVYRDFVFELFGCWHEDGQTTPKAKPKRPTESDSSCDEHPFTLVHRPRIPLADNARIASTDSEISSSEDEGFTLVHRPKQRQTPCEYASYPALQPERQRRFDPSTPCGPANPYPQKIVRGFEPIRPLPTTLPPTQQVWAENMSISSGNVLAGPSFLGEPQRDLRPAAGNPTLNSNIDNSNKAQLQTPQYSTTSTNEEDLVLVIRPKQEGDETISDSEWSMIE